MISRKFCKIPGDLLFEKVANAQCGKNKKLTATQIFFRQINLQQSSLIWRNFCEKIVAGKFRNFHSVQTVDIVEITETQWRKMKNLLSSHRKKIRQINYLVNLSTSIYDLVLIYVCHFHHHHPTFWKFMLFYQIMDYRDTRA